MDWQLFEEWLIKVFLMVCCFSVVGFLVFLMVCCFSVVGFLAEGVASLRRIATALMSNVFELRRIAEAVERAAPPTPAEEEDDHVPG